jgi:hypothetical protein
VNVRHVVLILLVAVAGSWVVWRLPEEARNENSTATPRRSVNQAHVIIDSKPSRSPAAATPTSGLASPQAHVYIAKLHSLEACVDGGCDFPQTDPRSYGFALGRALQGELFKLADWCRQQGITDREIGETAVHFLQSENGHVQEAALDLMSTQPPRAENLQTILNNVIGGYDSRLIEFALLELERYDSPSDRAVIDEALAEALLTGAPFVAREISGHLADFIDDQSYSYFSTILDRLPENSVYRTQLEASLSDFRRRKSG